MSMIVFCVHPYDVSRSRCSVLRREKPVRSSEQNYYIKESP